MCTCVLEPKKVPRSVVGKNFNFVDVFDFSKSFRFRKGFEYHLIFTPGQLKHKKITYFDGQCAHVWIEPKRFPGQRWMKTSIFLFRNFFENEENHHIFAPGQLKYKNSLIWMDKVYMCELIQKGPHVCSGRKLQFCWFLEKFSKMKENIHIFTPGQLKYKNSLIWMEKGAHVWIDPKRSPGPCERKLELFRFFGKFLKLKRIIIFSLQDN